MTEHSYVMTNDERTFEMEVAHSADGSTWTRHRFCYGTGASGEPLFGAWGSWGLCKVAGA